MYSESIKPKVDVMFDDLRKRVNTIVSDSSTSKEATEKITKLVSSELATRSKSILSDMLFDLTDALMETDYFKDIAKQNRFTEINLRQEILSKYQFAPSETVDYNEASRAINALMVGGATFVVGGAIEVGYILITGLTFPSLVPIPIGVLIVASRGAALTDYYAIEPKRSKKAMVSAVDNYLDQTQKQFIGWFDEIEYYFDKRVEEIKQTM